MMDSECHEWDHECDDQECDDEVVGLVDEEVAEVEECDDQDFSLKE
ncbi:hypothetical protein IJS64_04630 [bacterium]|nr:hypothetical protein [bacterium]